MKTITVADRQQFRRKVGEYAAQGYTTLREDGGTIAMSRKKPFNWVLGIICLFIPIIGWIALAMMIVAANRGSEVIEISLDENAARSAA